MISDSQDMWPMRDVIFVSVGCIAAMFLVMRKNNLRELLALVAALLVLAVMNVLIVYIFGLSNWKWVTLVWWAAIFVSVAFSRLARLSARRN